MKGFAMIHSISNAESRNKIHPFSFSRRFSAFSVAFFSFFILLIPSLWLLLPKKTFSENENRMLASPPTFSVEALASGEYTERLAAYLQDHIPARDLMLKAKSTAELVLLKRENNRIVLLPHGYMVKRFSYSDEELSTLRENLQAIRALCTALSKTGRPTVFLCAPRAVDVLGDESLAEPPERSPWEAVKVECPEALSVTSLLREKSRRGEAIWFHTDHHWTPLGAYYAYQALGPSLGYVPYPRGAFTEETVSHQFLGTAYSACLSPLARPDEIKAFRYENDGEFLCINEQTGQTEGGFYREKALSQKDRYAYFLGPNTAHLRIEKQGEARPTLLVIKDSYAQCLVPFLARHFNVELLDLRYFRYDATETVREIVTAPTYAGALILCNADTLVSSVGFDHISPEKLQ